MESKLISITITPQGAYFIYSIKVPRGIHGKETKADEIISHGVHYKKIEEFCERIGIVITNKAVYNDYDMNNPILTRKGESLVYD